MRRLIVFLLVLALALALYHFGSTAGNRWYVWLNALLVALLVDTERRSRRERREAFRTGFYKALASRKKAAALRRLARRGAWNPSEMRTIRKKLRAVGDESDVKRLERQLARMGKHLPLMARSIPFWRAVGITIALSAVVALAVVLFYGT